MADSIEITEVVVFTVIMSIFITVLHFITYFISEIRLNRLQILGSLKVIRKADY